MSSKISLNQDTSEPGDFEHPQEIQREEIFCWLDTPGGFSQEVANLSFFLTAHLFALWMFTGDFFSQVPVGAVLFNIFYGYLGILGTTVGVHRLWAHKNFKATLPLQIILMILHTTTLHWPIHKWALEHRIHHKYTDTNADPSNANRGFWFSHVGWMFMRQHKDFKQKKKIFDMSDLEKDPVVRFQAKYYLRLAFVFVFALPVATLHYLGAPWFHSVVLNFARWAIATHIIASVNSVAPAWGERPYDRNVSPTEVPLLAYLMGGEGHHNFHHTFPNDYRSSEFGWTDNSSTFLIDMFAKMGWAYDLRKASEETIAKRKARTGDALSQAG